MRQLNPYLRLMRLHQPVGIWLLFWPCAWSLLLASGGVLPLRLLFLFAVGAVLMRSAGCIINDIADRNIDKHVERTKNRPLASGEISVWRAVLLLSFLLLLSLLVADNLGLQVVSWAAISLIPITIYPLMKRVIWWPQLFLGVVFNWGALMGWVAVRGSVELPAILLYVGGICWTLGYDTIYAHQDKKDDARIGVKSTALRLGDNTKRFVEIMYALAIFCFASAVNFSAIGASNSANIGGFLSFAVFIPAMLHGAWQVYSLDINSPISARKIFLSNIWFGALVFVGIYAVKIATTGA